MAAKSRLMTQLPMVDALDDQRAVPGPHVGLGNGWAADNLAASCNLRLVDLEATPTISPDNQAYREQAVGHAASNGRTPKGSTNLRPLRPRRFMAGTERVQSRLSPAKPRNLSLRECVPTHLRFWLAD